MSIVLVAIPTVVLLGALLMASAYFISANALHPRRKPIVRTPREHGLDYEDIEFRSTDGINLRGWLIPGGSNSGHGGIIILAHAMTFNRHGWSPGTWAESLYGQADVDFLPMVKTLHECGYAVLMFDLGNHGESDGRRVFGGGLNEYQDIAGAVDYVRHRYGEDAARIGIIAACGGANSTIVAMSKAKEHMRNVFFLVLLQPVTPRVLIRCVMKDMLTPLSLLLFPAVERFYRWGGGYDLEEMSPENYAAEIHVPTLHIQAKEDKWTTLADVENIYDRIAGPKELWLIEGKMKRFDTYVYLGKQPERILEFARRHFTENVVGSHGGDMGKEKATRRSPLPWEMADESHLLGCTAAQRGQEAKTGGVK